MLHPSTLILTDHFPALISLSSCINLRTLAIHLSPYTPDLDILHSIRSPYLEEIRVVIYDKLEGPTEPEVIDDLLCKFYDRSYQNNVKTFHVSLESMRPGPDLIPEWLVEDAKRLWPKFAQKGSINWVPVWWQE
jgi:hypothetical protein